MQVAEVDVNSRPGSMDVALTALVELCRPTWWGSTDQYSPCNTIFHSFSFRFGCKGGDCVPWLFPLPSHNLPISPTFSLSLSQTHIHTHKLNKYTYIICICICMYTWIDTHTRTHKLIWTHMCTRTNQNTCTRDQINANKHTHSQIPANTHVHTQSNCSAHLQVVATFFKQIAP